MSSKFKGGKVYFIINDADITQEIVNRSTSKSKSDMPIKQDPADGILKRVVEAVEPVNEIFYKLDWYDIDKIQIVWESFVEPKQ